MQENAGERLEQWDQSESMRGSSIEDSATRQRKLSNRLLVTTALVFGFIALVAAAPFIWIAVAAD